MNPTVIPIRRLLSIPVLLLACMLVPATGFADDEERATALFAGGCFWCGEEAFDAIKR